ncbi:MAG: hypothetical protein QW566_02505 [Candidatus Jordarchaeales archaeon]
MTKSEGSIIIFEEDGKRKEMDLSEFNKRYGSLQEVSKNSRIKVISVDFADLRRLHAQFEKERRLEESFRVLMTRLREAVRDVEGKLDEGERDVFREELRKAVEPLYTFMLENASVVMSDVSVSRTPVTGVVLKILEDGFELRRGVSPYAIEKLRGVLNLSIRRIFEVLKQYGGAKTVNMEGMVI